MKVRRIPACSSGGGLLDLGAAALVPEPAARVARLLRAAEGAGGGGLGLRAWSRAPVFVKPANLVIRPLDFSIVTRQRLFEGGKTKGASDNVWKPKRVRSFGSAPLNA